MTHSIKSTVVFLKAFRFPSFSETLPPGEYKIVTQLLEPVDRIEPGTWTSSVLVHLHPQASHPGLSRTLTVPLADLEKAVAKDKLTGKALTEFLLDEMLADPMIRLVMQADGVSESELREFYLGPSDGTRGLSGKGPGTAAPRGGGNARVAEPLIGSKRPGIGE